MSDQPSQNLDSKTFYNGSVSLYGRFDRFCHFCYCWFLLRISNMLLPILVITFLPSILILIMTQESPILYKDGEELGMLYENKYRIYIPYEEIPEGWVQALVAVEDQAFMTHHGINPYNIVGSMVANIKAGRIVRGGSTLTQQTAKNLYNRGKRVEENQVKIVEYLQKKERLKEENRKQVENINMAAKIEAKLWEMLNALRLITITAKDILEYYANQIPI